MTFEMYRQVIMTLEKLQEKLCWISPNVSLDEIYTTRMGEVNRFHLKLIVCSANGKENRKTSSTPRKF